MGSGFMALLMDGGKVEKDATGEIFAVWCKMQCRT